MKQLDRILCRIEEGIVAIALAVGTILAFIEVILRYFFGASLGFTHELVTFLLIITGLIGAAIGVRTKVHIGVDIAVKQFPVRFQKIIKIGALILCLLFCITFMILGIQQSQILANFGQVTPEMEIPLYIPNLIIPISFGLMTLRFIQEIIKYLKTPANKISEFENEGGHE